MLVAVEWSTIRVTLKRLGIVSTDAERVLFASATGAQGSITGYYDGLFVYEVLSSSGYRFKMFEKSITKVTNETFEK